MQLKCRTIEPSWYVKKNYLVYFSLCSAARSQGFLSPTVADLVLANNSYLAMPTYLNLAKLLN